MMGAPGMRSAVLPSKAFLTASRLQFCARLRIRANRTAYAVFGTRSTGGQLVSDVQPALPLWSAQQIADELSGVVCFDGPDEGLAACSGNRAALVREIGPQWVDWIDQKRNDLTAQSSTRRSTSG